MKILYSIQGTGNGHISRAKEIIPVLQSYGKVDTLVSGLNYKLTTPFTLNYQLHGVSYSLSKSGGIDYIRTLKNLNPFQFYKEAHEIPVHHYDLVINDFEPVTALACRIRKVPCISLSHQSSFLSNSVPIPNRIDHKAYWILRNYARCMDYVGLHFENYDSRIYTPVIRQEVRNGSIENQGHITVYLPAYSPQLLMAYFHQLEHHTFHIFTSVVQKAEKIKNVTLLPVQQESFTQSMVSSAGLITGGGFESPAEAIFLGKKVIMIPIKNQFEQECNAFAASQLGISTLPTINQKFHEVIEVWYNEKSPIQISYPNHTSILIDECLVRATQNIEYLLNPNNFR